MGAPFSTRDAIAPRDMPFFANLARSALAATARMTALRDRRAWWVGLPPCPLPRSVVPNADTGRADPTSGDALAIITCAARFARKLNFRCTSVRRPWTATRTFLSGWVPMRIGRGGRGSESGQDAGFPLAAGIPSPPSHAPCSRVATAGGGAAMRDLTPRRPRSPQMER